MWPVGLISCHDKSDVGMLRYHQCHRHMLCERRAYYAGLTITLFGPSQGSACNVPPMPLQMKGQFSNLPAARMHVPQSLLHWDHCVIRSFEKHLRIALGRAWSPTSSSKCSTCNVTRCGLGKPRSPQRVHLSNCSRTRPSLIIYPG